MHPGRTPETATGSTSARIERTCTPWELGVVGMSAEARTREKVAKAMREAMELREACAHVADSAKRAQLLDVAG